ncbi:MAG: MFS transporter [Promethearchaeota archaeon]|jgi:DHA3 family macrolide efflux protein-like MFS transporter
MEEIANKDTFRSYMLFWSGQLFSLLGSMVVFFVITFWVADVYGDPVISAFSSFLFILMMTICMPIAGVIADRVNKKKLILVVDSLQAFTTFLLIMFFQFNLANIWIVYIFISLRSVFQAFHVPTVNAIIPTMVPKDKLSRINGVNYLFTGVVQLFAPFLGALLMIFFSVYMIFWIDIVTFFIALLPLLLITIPSVKQINHSEKAGEKSSFIREFKLGFKALKLVPGLIIMIVLSMFLNFLIRPVDSLMALFIIDVHGGGAVHIAFSQMVFTGGMIAGAILTSLKKNWNNKMRVIFISIMVALIGYMTFAVAPSGSFLIVGLGGAILGFNMPIINSLYQTFLQTTVPADKLGRVTSIDHTLSSLISPFGSLLSGPLALLLGIPALFFYCGLIGVLVTIGFWSFTGIRKVNIDSEKELEKINGKIEEIVA